MDFDDDTGVLYFAVFDSVANEGQLRTVDIETGNTTLISAFPGGAAVDGLAIVADGRVEFELERPGRTKIRVFDSMGREVSTVLDHYLDAGRHTIKLSGRDWSSGAYLITLVTDSRTHTTKIIVI